MLKSKAISIQNHMVISKNIETIEIYSLIKKAQVYNVKTPKILKIFGSFLKNRNFYE